jgi:hypothetical protein
MGLFFIGLLMSLWLAIQFPIADALVGLQGGITGSLDPNRRDKARAAAFPSKQMTCVTAQTRRPSTAAMIFVGADPAKSAQQQRD